MSLEEKIFNNLVQLKQDDRVIVKRIAKVAASLDVLLRNIQFCKESSFLWNGKIYSHDDVVILLFEFYLLSKKFNVIPKFDIEQLLLRYGDRLKQLAAEGRLSGLLAELK